MEKIVRNEIIYHDPIVYKVLDIVPDCIIIGHECSTKLPHFHIYGVWIVLEE